MYLAFFVLGHFWHICKKSKISKDFSGIKLCKVTWENIKSANFGEK